MYVYSDVKRLHTHTHTHRGAFAHTDAFTHRIFHTEKPLHRGAFTDRRLYTQKLLRTEKSLHRGAFTHICVYTQALTQRSLYTAELLHREVFTQRSFYTDTFTQRSLYTDELLHREAPAQRSYYTQTRLHAKGFTCRSFYTQAFTPRSFCKENPCHSVTLHNGNFTPVLPEMLRPRTGTTVLCEPAQSKCTWTCHKSIQERFCVRILRGNAAPQELAKLAPQTLCEPAQSKCIASEFLISQFYTLVLDVRPFFRAKGGAVTHKIRISPHVCASYVRHARSLRRVDYVKALPHNVGA